METIESGMRTQEHCQECGALLVTIPGAVVCAHCGFEEQKLDAGLLAVYLAQGRGPTVRNEPSLAA